MRGTCATENRVLSENSDASPIVVRQRLANSGWTGFGREVLVTACVVAPPASQWQDGRIVKRIAVADLLLGLLGVAACGGDESEPAVEVPAWAKVAPEQIAEAKKHDVPVAFENQVGMRFVLIPAGTFLMGTPSDEVRWSWETPQHEVTISRPFYMAIYEVTNGQYRAFRPDHDSGDDADWEATAEDDLNGDRQPAVGIPDVDAMAFSRWLGAREGGRTYALPTEAEWHYACRAGSSTTFAWGDNPADAAKSGTESGNPVEETRIRNRANVRLPWRDSIPIRRSRFT